MSSSTSRTRVSSRLTRAAGAERMTLLRERDRLARRRGALAEQLAAVERELADVEERLELIDRLVPGAANVHPLPSREPQGARDGLRGAAIREAAIAVLLAAAEASGGAPTPIHYKAWFHAVEQAGHRIAGKDPLAVFLTQISRSPLVRRTAEAGVYELDLNAPRNLRDRLERLHTRLADISAIPAVPAAPAEREERDRLLAEIALAERALDEAERTLSPRRRDADARGRRAVN